MAIKRMTIIGVITWMLLSVNACTNIAPNDPTPTVWSGGVPPQNVAAVINDNRARWQKTLTTNYRYQLTINCFCFPQRDILPLTIEVRDGQLTKITANGGTPYPASDPMYAFVQDMRRLMLFLSH
jgi:hypothetical protein